jgi:hypothetical protein
MMRSMHLILVISLLFFTILASGCCNDIRFPASVVADPLYQVKMPQDVGDLRDIFDQGFLDQINAEEVHSYNDYLAIYTSSLSSYDYVRVEITLFVSEDESEQSYKDECNEYMDYQNPSKFTYLGSAGNQYCISYVKQGRGGRDSFCQPYETYFTKAVFQKSRITITLKETAWDMRNEQMNRVIQILSEQLSK